MAGSKNSQMEELFGKVEGGVIDNDKEYKKFEKVVQDDEGREDLEHQVDSKGDQILQSFGDGLDAKIQAAKADFDPNAPEKKGAMKKNVREAYMVLGKLRDKAPKKPAAKPAAAPTEQPADQSAQRVPEGNGRAGLYKEMKNAAEQEATLDKKYQEIVKMIDNNPEWSYNSKQSAKEVIKQLFAECNTVEEFEKRAGRRLGAINSFDNVKDVIKGAGRAVYEAHKIPSKAYFELCRQCGVAKEELDKMWNEALKTGQATLDEFYEWSKEAGKTVEDITKTVLQLGEDMFKQFLNYLESIKEGVQEALNAAWEFCGNQWDKFVNMCGGVRDAIVAFGKDLVEKGKLAWKTFLESMKNAWDKVTDICTDLINKGKIKMGEFVEWCNGLAQKGRELLTKVIESSVSMWNQFADWCKDNWEAGKAAFKEVARTLLEKGKMTLEAFTEWCKSAGEAIKEYACSILVGLVKAGKFALEVVCGALLVIVGSVVLLGELLVKAGKEVYKKGKELANFVSRVALNLWEKSKDAFKTAGEYIKHMLNKCKEYGIATAEFVKNFVKDTWEKMKELGISAKDFMIATYESVRSSLKGAWDTTAEFFKGLGMKIEDIVVTLYESAKGTWKSCADFIAHAIEKGWLNFKSAMSLMVDKCKMAIDKVGRAFVKGKKYVVEFINYVKEKGLITLNRIKEWCGNNIKEMEAFIKAAIDKAKATWKDLKEWCGGKIDALKNVLNNLYGKTKEGVKWLLNFMKEGGMAILEAGKLMLTLGIGLVALVVIGLKEAGEALANVAKICVDTLVKYGKIAANKICDFLAEAYGSTKEMCIKIGQCVAEGIRDAAKGVRDWIYQKTRDAKRAYEAMRNFIRDGVKDVASWLYKRGVALVDVCKTIKNAFGTSLKTAWEGLKAFATECKVGLGELMKACGDWLINV